MMVSSTFTLIWQFYPNPNWADFHTIDSPTFTVPATSSSPPAELSIRLFREEDYTWGLLRRGVNNVWDEIRLECDVSVEGSLTQRNNVILRWNSTASDKYSLGIKDLMSQKLLKFQFLGILQQASSFLISSNYHTTSTILQVPLSQLGSRPGIILWFNPTADKYSKCRYLTQQCYENSITVEIYHPDLNTPLPDLLCNVSELNSNGDEMNIYHPTFLLSRRYFQKMSPPTSFYDPAQYEVTAITVRHQSIPMDQNSFLKIANTSPQPNNLNLLPLFLQPLYSDFTLLVGSQRIPVHRNILAARSPFFEAMFETDMREKNEGCAVLKDIDVDIVQGLLRFFYGQELPDAMDKDLLTRLYSAADQFLALEVSAHCSKLMASQLTIENACNVLVLADAHKDEGLKSQVREFIFINKAVVSSASWDCFKKQNVELALETMELLYKNMFPIL